MIRVTIHKSLVHNIMCYCSRVYVYTCTPYVVSRASAHSWVSAYNVCTAFLGVNVAASIQTYGSYIAGKSPCKPKLV